MLKVRISNPGEIVDQLRSQGYKVFVSHKRPLKGVKNSICFSRQEMIDFDLDPSQFWDIRGGKTTVHIYGQDKELLGYGESVCSRHDVFEKHRGLTIALGRALSNGNISL